MRQKIAHMLIALGAVVALGSGSLALAPAAHAVNPGNEINKGITAAGGGGAKTTSLNDNIKKIVNILLFIIGVIAVIMIVIGGLRYTISGGDASQTKAAKDTILYAVVGIVVAILAYAIVNFVVKSF